MNIPYEKNMTNDMLDCVRVVYNEDWLKKEFLYCHEQYLKADRVGKIKLPHTTESGESVVHGARLVIYDIANFWEVRRDAIRKYLPREWVDLIMHKG